MKKTLTAAVLGTGFMGKTHLEVIKDLAEKIFICTTDIAEGEKLCEQYGAVLYTDFNELFDKEKIDFVSVCLPTPLHHDAVIAAANHKINVLCEKPFARSSVECEEMIEAAKKNNVLLMVAHPVRFTKAYEYLRRVLTEKRYGNLKFLSLTRHSAMPPWSVGDWLNNPNISGGPVKDMHIHDTDYLLSVLGIPSAVVTTGNVIGTHTIYSYDGLDAAVHGSVSWRAITGYDFNASFDAAFETGSVVSDNGNLKLYTLKGGFIENPMESEDFSPYFVSENAYENEIKYFVSCILENRPPLLCTPEDSLISIKINEFEVESMARGKQVKVTI